MKVTTDQLKPGNVTATPMRPLTKEEADKIREFLNVFLELPT